MPKRFFTFFHILILFICVVAIALYFYYPIWKVTISYTFGANTLKSMLGEGFADYDLDEAIPGDGIPVSLTLTIDTPFLCAAVLQPDGMQTVDELVEENIDNVAEDLTDSIGDVTKTVVKVIVKEAIKQEIVEQIKDYIDKTNETDETDKGTTTTEEAKEIMNEVGLTDEYIDEKTAAIIEAVYADGATVESVTDVTMQIVEESYVILKDSGSPEVDGIVLNDDNEALIRSQIEGVLSSFANEDGTINADLQMQIFILQALQVANSYKASNSIGYNNLGIAIASFSSSSTEAETETSEAEETETVVETETATRAAIKEQLVIFFNELIGEEGYAYIHIAVISELIFFIISVACWAYMAIKALTQLIQQREGLKLKVPILFGWLPCLSLVVVPSISYFIAKYCVPNLASPLSTLNMSFFSSGFFAFVAAMLLAVLSFVRYAVKKSSEDEYDRF